MLTDASTYNHAFVVLDHGLAAEPWPSGARVVPLSDFDGEDVAYGWLPGLSGDQQRRIVRSAVDLLGAYHGLIDYWALARHRKGSRSQRVVSWMCRTDRLLPAQFIAESYRAAGLYLFPDRIGQDVTLDQIGELFLTGQEWELRVPCTLYA